MTNHKSIRQPSHDRIVLSKATATVVHGEVVLTPLDLASIDVTLDANDAIRLAAFLNRFHAEQDQAAQKADDAQARRAARVRSVRMVK